MQSPVNEFGGFLDVSRALEETGHSNEFCHCLRFVTKTLMSQGEARVSHHMIRVEHGHPHPVLDGFICISLVKEKFCGPGGGIDGFFEMTCAFEKLSKFFHRGWVIGGYLRCTFV